MQGGTGDGTSTFEVNNMNKPEGRSREESAEDTGRLEASEAILAAQTDELRVCKQTVAVLQEQRDQGSAEAVAASAMLREEREKWHAQRAGLLRELGQAKAIIHELEMREGLGYPDTPQVQGGEEAVVGLVRKEKEVVVQGKTKLKKAPGKKRVGVKATHSSGGDPWIWRPD